MRFAPLLLFLLAGCSALGATTGATIGAGIGLLGGPATGIGGAAVGAFIGDLSAGGMSGGTAPPETVWALLGKVVDAAPMLLILAIILWVLSLCSPSPLAWVRKKLKDRK